MAGAMLLVSGSVDQLGDSRCNSSPKSNNFSVLRLSRSTRHFVRKLPNRRGGAEFNVAGLKTTTFQDNIWMPLSLLTYGSIPGDPLIPPRSTWNQETYSASAGIHLAQPQVCRFKIVQGKWRSLYFQSTQPIFFNFWHISGWFLPFKGKTG